MKLQRDLSSSRIAAMSHYHDYLLTSSAPEGGCVQVHNNHIYIIAKQFPQHPSEG
jgi:hypothetical protein